MSHPSRDRLQRVARAMDAQGIDVLVLTPGASMFYLSGFEHGHAAERLLALVLKRDGSASWIVPAMNVRRSATTHCPTNRSARGPTERDTSPRCVRRSAARTPSPSTTRPAPRS